MIQPGEAHVQDQHDAQHKPVRGHGAGLPLQAERLLHQTLETELFQHGGYRQQTAVGRQIVRGEIIGRGSPDFQRLRDSRFHPLCGGCFPAMLSIVIHLLGDS